MKTIRIISSIFLFLGVMQGVRSQLPYPDTSGWGGWRLLGFIEKVRPVESYLDEWDELTYIPKLRIIDDVLYVCSNSGLFRRNLSVPEARFEPCGFRKIPLVDVVRNGNAYMAIRAAQGNEDKRLLRSEDDGDTWQDVTPPHFVSELSNTLMAGFAQNPLKQTSLLVYGDCLHRSFDFGKTWHCVVDQSVYTKIFTLKYQPSDTTIAFMPGSNWAGWGSELKRIHLDDEKVETINLMNTEAGLASCIAFNPINPDEMVCSVAPDPWFWKTTDGGDTWRNISGRNDYGGMVQWLFYDERNPEYMYGIPAYAYGVEKYIDVLISSDGGENWRLYYRQEVDSAEIGGIVDVVMYHGTLFLYTQNAGVWIWGDLPVSGSPESPLSKESVREEFPLSIASNPARGVLRFASPERICRVEIVDMSGRTLRRENLSLGSTEVSLQDIPPGLYVIGFHTDRACVRKKVSVVR